MALTIILNGQSRTFAGLAESASVEELIAELGLKGDRVAVLAYNCVEWCEIFAATAKAGLVALPINFRLIGNEVQFIVSNGEAAAFIVQDEFVGLANFIAYARTPALLESLWNSLWVSSAVTAIAVPLAFGFAYALTRSCMPLKPLFRGITLIPLLAPSLLAAISLGAVFMGANSYIGNAPNLMVKLIAEQRGIKMPGFFGYMLYSSLVLIPLFIAVSLLFFG